MILIVDTNRIIASLIRDSSSRRIIMSPKFKFMSLNLSKTEIAKYTDEIMGKAAISKEEFERLFVIFFNKIEILDDLVIEEYMNEAGKIMDSIDPNDTPFIAAALAENCDVWSDDEHFYKQNKIKAWKTADLIKFL